MNNAIKHFIIPFALLALMTACGGNNMCMEGSRRTAARLTNTYTDLDNYDRTKYRIIYTRRTFGLRLE